MNPETLETITNISQWTANLIGAVSVLGGSAVITRAIPHYNIDKQIYDEWSDVAEDAKDPALRNYIHKVQKELGEPKLKEYFLEAAKEIFTLYSKRNPEFEPKHSKIGKTNIDVKWKKNMVETGIYNIGKDGMLVEAKEDLQKHMREN